MGRDAGREPPEQQVTVGGVGGSTLQTPFGIQQQAPGLMTDRTPGTSLGPGVKLPRLQCRGQGFSPSWGT